MSVSGISGKDFDFSLLNGASRGSAGATDFASTLALSIANSKSQTLGTLMDSVSGIGDAGASSIADSFLTSQNTSTSPTSPLAGGVNGLSATGRNTALFDPESAYKMMSVINNADVTYKAQFSELSQMKTSVAGMEQDAQGLGGIDSSTGNDDIESRLQAFAGQYNAWVKRFDADMQSGGVLAGTQAAQVARYELDQSVENVFNGAKDGLHGLADMGFNIDLNTGLASLDTGKLESVLAANKTGAVDTLQEFSANFAKSADLLDSKGNFIQNRLDNLGGAIHFIADNKSSLQSEFGTGDAAQPTGQIAQALAAYNQAYGI